MSTIEDEPPEHESQAGDPGRGPLKRRADARASTLRGHQSAQARRRWPPFAQKLGRRVRRLREQRGLKQESLAYEAHCSQSMLSRIENGEALPDFMQMVLIARALDLSVEFFATDEDQRVEAGMF